MPIEQRPSDELEWASAAPPANISEPDNAQKTGGWVIQKPSLQHFNWWMNLAWLWQKYFDARIPNTNVQQVTAAGSTALTLKSGMYYFDATLGNQTAVLPTISASDNGLEILIKKVDASANTVTIQGTIEGQVNSIIEYQYTGRTVVAVNGSWFWKG